MYLTSDARGLTAGLASPLSAGVRPCTRPTVGAELSVAVTMIALRKYSMPPANAGTPRRARCADSRSSCSEISVELGIGSRTISGPGNRHTTAGDQIAVLEAGTLVRARKF